MNLSQTFSLVPNATTTTAYWGFDSNADDLYGVYNGVLVNGATYSNTTYFGYGANSQLNASINQSIVVSSPFLNLSSISFTVEAWIYGYSFTGDNAIFSQCECSTCQDQCLSFIIRNYKMYMRVWVWGVGEGEGGRGWVKMRVKRRPSAHPHPPSPSPTLNFMIVSRDMHRIVYP
jgi:hypothetical protein